MLGARPDLVRDVTRLVHPDGSAVADDERFVVAVNNYRRSGGGNFPHVSTAPVVYNEQLEIRQLLIEWAQERGVEDPAEFPAPSWWLVRAGSTGSPVPSGGPPMSNSWST